MIYYVLLVCLPFVSIFQSVAQKQYTLQEKNPNVILFSSITAFIALCFFILTSGFKLTFDARLIPYSLLFAAGYCASWIGTVYAVRYGSMALTSLITSFSLILPTSSALGMVIAFLLAYVVYKERFTKPQYAGYALGVVSLILLNI